MSIPLCLQQSMSESVVPSSSKALRPVTLEVFFTRAEVAVFSVNTWVVAPGWGGSHLPLRNGG
jgi:hypothetical protein